MSDPNPLRRALEAAAPKPEPEAERDDKKNYAQRLSNALAQTVADQLRPAFPTVTPTASGKGQEEAVPVERGRKRLDVKVVDPVLGLILNVSIKTYSFQDYDRKNDRLGRWTKNAVRNDHELRGEAMVLHQRQPYSVLVALMFQPWEICDDGGRSPSSFSHHVGTLSKRAGRGRRPVYNAGGTSESFVDYGAQDPRHDLFERAFIGLYEVEGDDAGSVRFFDVEHAPPRTGRPNEQQTLSFEALIASIQHEVDRRNRFAPVWSEPEVADGD